MKVQYLLLGAGNVGKSTVLKQAQLSFQREFTPEEREADKTRVILNVQASLTAFLGSLAILELVLTAESVSTNMRWEHDCAASSTSPVVSNVM